MSKKGPIIIIDKDQDDQELMRLALQNLNVRNKILVFEDGHTALTFLKSSSDTPFLIISNIRVPKMDGLQLKAEINENETLKKKSIPFILLSETAERQEVDRAYELHVQGFFIKPNSIESLQEKLELILGYWDLSVEPNQLLY